MGYFVIGLIIILMWKQHCEMSLSILKNYRFNKFVFFFIYIFFVYM